jgi:hypothetical protein
MMSSLDRSGTQCPRHSPLGEPLQHPSPGGSPCPSTIGKPEAVLYPGHRVREINVWSRTVARCSAAGRDGSPKRDSPGRPRRREHRGVKRSDHRAAAPMYANATDPLSCGLGRCLHSLFSTSVGCLGSPMCLPSIDNEALLGTAVPLGPGGACRRGLSSSQHGTAISTVGPFTVAWTCRRCAKDPDTP